MQNHETKEDSKCNVKEERWRKELKRDNILLLKQTDVTSRARVRRARAVYLPYICKYVR